MRVDAEVAQIGKAVDDGAKGAFRGEGADVQFVDHEIAKGRARPRLVRPAEGPRVDDHATGPKRRRPESARRGRGMPRRTPARKGNDLPPTPPGSSWLMVAVALPASAQACAPPLGGGDAYGRRSGLRRPDADSERPFRGKLGSL
jgi:hypothetical protein